MKIFPNYKVEPKNEAWNWRGSVHSFNKYLLSANSVPGISLGFGDTAEKKMKIPTLWNLDLNRGEIDSEEWRE